MSDLLPKVSVIIAARPDQTDIKALDAARGFDYPADCLEVIVARGTQPSVQRNAALKAASGELIYFLDDDSVPGPGMLRRAVAQFANPAVQMVGGPNLCPPDAPSLEQVFAVVLASWLAFGPSRARYSAVGEARETGEKELILCNLVARRQPMIELGGFDEALYPNEENALMDDLRKRGGKLIYDPQLIVHRRPRRSLKAFAKMLMTYGRGRAEQFRLHPTLGSILNFVPPLFCVYLAALVVVQVTGFGSPLARWSLAPLAVYLLSVVLQTIASMPNSGAARSLLAMPLIVLTHLLYGAGFWRGLFTTLKKSRAQPSTTVALERINLG